MDGTESSWLRTAWLFALYLPGVIAAGHAVMFKRDPRSAAIWLVINLFVPIIGPCFYYGFGINRVERRATRRLGRRELPFDPGRGPREDIRPVQPDHESLGHLLRLRLVADHVTRLPMVRGNRVEPLHNGEQAYPRMLEAIAKAERTVTLASYIFDWDDIGNRFTDALIAAAGRGVKTHLLVDGIGAVKSFSRTGRRLLQTNVKLASFFPLRFPFGRVRLNLRNHRKILVVDGHRGFTGGMNISRKHLLDSDAPDRVEDLHFELNGPVVAELQHTFVEDWALATNEMIDGEDYFPTLQPAGNSICRGFASGPDEDFETVYWIILAALGAAEKSVWIATPYFIPTVPLISALSLAAMRGVEVNLLLPSCLDLPYMRWASDAFLWQLLEHGVQVFHRPPPFVHTKLLIVDDRWVLMGSANCDPRSFRLNFEFNVETYDTELATNLATWLAELRKSSTPVALADVDSRSLPRRLRDGVVRLFAPHL